MIRTGPAGWSYPDSPGRVYPKEVPSRFDALGFLASYFDAIEVNSTFYRPQPASTYAGWARRVSHNPAFRFTVKLWRRFTHEREAPWTRDDLGQVRPGLEALRDASQLGAVLAQFPWSFKPSPDARALLRQLAADLQEWPLVVELRHGAWGKPRHLAFVRDLGLGFANIDQPVIGASLAPTSLATSPVGYVRFHGRNYEQWFEQNEDAAQRYDYLYTAEELAPWVERIRSLAGAGGVEDVYVIANNHYEGKGPANALMMRAMLEERKVPAPPTLFDRYRQVLEPYAEATAPSGEQRSLF